MDLLLRRRNIISNRAGLPSGYTALEYLSNHLTADSATMAYINPLVYCDEIGYVEIEMCYTGNPAYIVGDGAIDNQNYPNFYCLLGITSERRLSVQFGTNNQEKNFYAQYLSGTYYKFAIDVINQKGYCNNEEVNIEVSSILRVPFFIFWRSLNGGTFGAGRAYGSKRKECKFYNRSMVLIRDLIPARNSNGIAGMFDKVNQVFYISPNGSAFDQTI